MRQVPKLFFSDSATLTRISKLIKSVGKHHPLKVIPLQCCEGWHGVWPLQTGRQGQGSGCKHCSSAFTAYSCSGGLASHHLGVHATSGGFTDLRPMFPAVKLLRARLHIKPGT